MEKADDVILVGSKPFMNYITGVVMQFTVHNAPQVIVKARGQFISKAVDIAEVAAKRFLDGQVVVGGIKTGSAGFKNSEGRDIRVSTIEIALERK